MNQPRIAKLRSQRGRPPYFAGRTEELAALNKRLDDLCKNEAVAVLEAASYDGEATVDAAIAHGVLTLEKGGVGFGIPSFHTHMVRRLEAHRRLPRASAT